MSQMDPYATHLPMLLKCVGMTASLGGPVLELGCGHYSTPILHEVCRGRRLVSVETDTAWAGTFEHLHGDGSHTIHLVRSFADYDLDQCHWDVALVDHGMASRRVQDIQRLAERALLIVVHDTEDRLYGYGRIGGSFKCAYTYDLLRPWTTVFSNFIPLSDFGPGPHRYVEV